MKTLFKPHLKEAFIKMFNYNASKIDRRNKIEKEEEYIKNKEDKKIKKDKKENVNDFSKNSSENSEKYKKIAKRYLEYSPTYTKAKSYLYESSSEDSSFSVRPNSLDNHQWAKIQAKLQLARYRIINNEFENEEIEDNLDESDNINNKKENKREQKRKKNQVKIKENIEDSDESSISLKEQELINNIKKVNQNENQNKKEKNLSCFPSQTV